MNSLKNKNIIITGFTGGIGSAICKLVKENGAKTFGICRNSRPDEVDYKITDYYLNHDLSNPLPVETIKAIISKFKRIDYLIHSAGILIPTEFSELKESEIQSVINANLLSTIHIIKAVLPVMKLQGGGHIIIIGSLGGIIPMPYEAVYAAAKFGVRGLCLSLVEELKAAGIKISLISPGSVKTQMLDTESSNKNSIISFIQKPFSPEYIAEEILKVIHHPKTEVIIPKFSSALSILFNYSPALFYKVFALMRQLGKRRLSQYASKYLYRKDISAKAVRG